MKTYKNHSFSKFFMILLALILIGTATPVSAASNAKVNEGTYEIESYLKGGRVLGLSGKNLVTKTRVAGGRNEDRFELTSVGGGFYKIRNVKTGKVIDVTAGMKEIYDLACKNTINSREAALKLYRRNGGIRISLSGYAGLPGQKWQLESAGKGYYYCKCYPIASMKNFPVYLSVCGGKAADNMPLVAEAKITLDTRNRIVPKVVFSAPTKINAAKFKLNIVEKKTVTDKKAAFQKDKRWKNGTSWKAIRPKLSRADGTGCYALCADYTKYVYGKDDPKSGKTFKKTNDIRTGDILYVKNGNEPHWIIVLERNGNTLTTMERYSNKVSITTGRYNVKNGKLAGKKGTSCPKQLVRGYHFQ